jgi:hypothetical protein
MMARAVGHDLIVLDVMQPGRDGANRRLLAGGLVSAYRKRVRADAFVSAYGRWARVSGRLRQVN